MAERWSPDHLRLHRLLRRRPELLPPGDTLLLAVSGGQDSMALVGLLLDLRRLHHWTLQLWHGDHGWRAESSAQADGLAAWARQRGLPLRRDRWADPIATEAAAREWRTGCLIRRARELGASRVVTGHTASDRAETLLLQLARGTHRRGLTGPQALRPLTEALQLARPLLLFSRADTARLCSALELPLWPDPSNGDPAFGRNRIRHEVLPVLEALHPGSGRRLAALSERLAEEEAGLTELADLALSGLAPATSDRDAPAAGARAAAATAPTGPLDRRRLQALQPANQRRLLQRWLERQGAAHLAAAQLEALLQRLPPQQGPGCQRLSGALQLCWNRDRLWLAPTDAPATTGAPSGSSLP